MSSLDASQTNVETSNAAEREVHVLGELVYGYTLLVTRVVEYGASANTLLSGQASTAPEGARIDFYLEGSVIGPKLTGTVKGVDYLYFRADGRAQLHIHAEITTEDGKKIALAADGIAIPELDDFVSRLYFALFEHPEVKAWTVVGDKQCGNPRIIHADPDAIAGAARLRYLEDRAANLVAVANAHLVVGQSLHSEVLAERLSRDRTNAAGMPV